LNRIGQRLERMRLKHCMAGMVGALLVTGWAFGVIPLGAGNWADARRAAPEISHSPNDLPPAIGAHGDLVGLPKAADREETTLAALAGLTVGAGIQPPLFTVGGFYPRNEPVGYYGALTLAPNSEMTATAVTR
jgi:hypothetical protein